MPVTIRFRLLLLVLTVLLPAVLGSGWLIVSALRAERESHELRLQGTARALSMLVDGELSQRVTVAQVLAQSRWLDDGAAITPEQLQRFETLARRSLRDLAGWIELRVPGRLLLDTRLPPGERPSLASADEFFLEARVLPLRLTGEPHAAVVEPVQRDGRVELNLLITLRPAELQRLVDAQQFPAGWVGTVVDDHGVVVARHPGGSTFVGQRATADLRSRLARQTEAHFHSVSLDGLATVGYFRTSERGWTYVSAMPAGQFIGGMSQTAVQMVLGALVLLASAIGGALWLSRRIVEPVQALKQSALRMQAGQPLQHSPTGVTELDEVGRALVDAGAVIQQGRADLERQVTDAVARTRLAEQRASHNQRIDALGRLTGGIAHDFNNLLGVISNSLHLIERQSSVAALDTPIGAIRRSVLTGSQLTQHLLRFAGHRRVQPMPLQLSGWLDEVQALLSSVLGRRIQTRLHVEPDTAPVQVDAGELELALMNLALNARDAMPTGGELRLSARNAGLAECQGLPGSPQPCFVIITVSDDGTGITPDLATRVFEPFFTTKPVGQGAGLGLSQVHGFCSQAGGMVRLDSTPGLGTSVSLILPAFSGRTDGGPPTPPPAPAIDGLRLLLVEDNDELALVTSELLRTHGVAVQRAESAADALRLLAVQPFFDVILSDVVMPGELDGLELARRVREEFPALQIVLISGYSGAVASNEFRVLHKPCAPRELLQALHEAMKAAQPATH